MPADGPSARGQASFRAAGCSAVMSTVNSSTPASPMTRTVGESGVVDVDGGDDARAAVGQLDLVAERVGHDDGAEVADDVRAELRARALADDAHADVGQLGGLVDALGGDGVVDVGDRRDARELLDLGAEQALRVAGAVEALVVVAHDGDGERREVGGAQQLDAGVAWVFMIAISSSLSGPGLLRISGGTESLPTSWTSSPSPSLRMRSSRRS